MTVLGDPHGATFIASRFVPENKGPAATLSMSPGARNKR
jgi:hypothetical protein